MSEVSFETRIDAPIDRVWEVLSDFGGIWRFNPSVNESHLTSDANQGVGAERHCDLTFAGTTVEERIVDWQEGRSYDVLIVSGTRMPPMTDILAHFDIEPDGDGTIVRGSMRYDMKYGPIGWVLDRVLIRPRFGKAFGLILAGLKHHVETGEVVTADMGIDLRAVQTVAV